MIYSFSFEREDGDRRVLLLEFAGDLEAVGAVREFNEHGPDTWRVASMSHGDTRLYDLAAFDGDAVAALDDAWDTAWDVVRVEGFHPGE